MKQRLATAVLVLAAACAAAPEPAPTTTPSEPQTNASPWADAVAAEANELEKAFPTATVRIAVLDVRSGELLASHGPIDSAHPVGSTVKSFTIAAALEAGVSPSTPLDTGDGETMFGELTIRDHTSHGTIDVEQALARSSNVAIVRLVEQVGEAELYRRVAEVLPVPPRTELDAPTAVQVLFGGRLALTTEQLVRGYAVLAAGGVDPRSGTRLVDEAAASQVLRMLEHAVTGSDGTGKHAAVAGRRVAGKTGTASNGDKNTALFVGITEDRDRPIVVGIVVDGVPTSETGSTVSAPAFARLVAAAT